MLKSSNNVIVIAREKEILWKLLNENGIEYMKFSHSKSSNIFVKFLYYLKNLTRFLRIAKQSKANFFISKASINTVFVKLFVRKCKAYIFPDSEVVWLTNRVVVKFADKVFTPEIFERDFGKKHIRVPGIFENSYLSPLYSSIVPIDLSEKGYNTDQKTVFLRFVGWKANHDFKHFGFSHSQKEELVNLFHKHSFNILISSEAKLSEELLEFQCPYPASMVHSVLKACNYYVGDSQTMASESALLGLKSYRFNSFVGENDMANFKYLENKRRLRNYNNFSQLIRSLENEIVGSSKFFSEIGSYWEESVDQNQFILELITSH